jgi:hypothetical protein
VSPTVSFALRSRLDPRHIVLGDIELLELSPRGDGLCTRRPLIGSEELRYEVDVATVRDPLESLHLVQDNVLPDEIAVRREIAAEKSRVCLLCFETNLSGHHCGRKEQQDHTRNDWDGP